MSNNPYAESSFAKFFRKKSVCAACALCLVGAAASGAVFLSREEKKPQEEIEKPLPPVTTEQREIPSLQEEISFSPKKEEKLENKKEDKIPEAQISVSKTEIMGVLPCKGEIIFPFSKGELVKDETMGDWRTHNGIDISSKAGAEVYAFASGKVTGVRNDSLWGTVVEVRHAGAVETKYCGLGENVKVSEGDSVKAGQVIGYLANIPCEAAKETHLHFELVDKGKYKDPAEFIK